MSELLDQAFARVRELPSEQQDAIATWLMQWTADDLPPIVLTDEEKHSFVLSLDQAARGEFVSDEAMQELWTKHGL